MESEPLLINKVAALTHWALKVIDAPFFSFFFKDAVVQLFVLGSQSVQNRFCFSQINSFKPVHLSDILGNFCQRFVDYRICILKMSTEEGIYNSLNKSDL